MPRKRKAGKHYFTKDHENAIIDYVATDDQKIRTQLYIDWIGPAFDEMVDKIVYTYKFTTLPNVDALKDECKVWLTTILDKYDPSKGSKAFSYFSVITKNWFIAKVKRTSKKMKREVSIDYIQKVVSDYFQMDIETLQSKTRRRHIVQARQLAMYFAKKFTKASLASIGSQIGKRDHATVLHACKTVDNLTFTDKQFRKYVEDLSQKLSP